LQHCEGFAKGQGFLLYQGMKIFKAYFKHKFYR
jgi:hypothetical protein